MENIEGKSHAEDDASSFGPLPDDVVLHILNKVIDFKALCPCKLVSKRFCRITRQVNTISLKTKPSTSFDSFLALRKFGHLKSLSIVIPSSPNDPFLVKWKVSCGIKLDSFLYLSPNSTYPNKELYVNANGHEQEEEEEDTELEIDKFLNAKSRLDTAVMSHAMLLSCIANLRLLEKVFITDSHQRCWISLSGGKVSEMRNGLISRYETVRLNRVKKCYVPLLELPVSGYVMKGVTLYLMERVDLPDGNDTLMNTDGDFRDNEEAVFNEAVREIFKKHKARIVRLDDFTSHTFL